MTLPRAQRSLEPGPGEHQRRAVGSGRSLGLLGSRPDGFQEESGSRPQRMMAIPQRKNGNKNQFSALSLFFPTRIPSRDVAALLVSPLYLRVLTIVFLLHRFGSSPGSRFRSLLARSLFALVLLRLASAAVLWFLLPFFTRLCVQDIRVGYRFRVSDAPERAPGVWFCRLGATFRNRGDGRPVTGLEPLSSKHADEYLQMKLYNIAASQ
ncbi:hypothetical protein NDU88_000968 [Pleurodeles waltl]|uniref:Transmembrane protein n=1 Tax=Pleurodeles waltl TaxID=8319 RepID=A0AAV7S9E1_PLEWA|nr:hypothetical protein NDU88_000968 [Pleurodeles waltl]